MVITRTGLLAEFSVLPSRKQLGARRELESCTPAPRHPAVGDVWRLTGQSSAFINLNPSAKGYQGSSPCLVPER